MWFSGRMCDGTASETNITCFPRVSLYSCSNPRCSAMTPWKPCRNATAMTRRMELAMNGRRQIRLPSVLVRRPLPRPSIGDANEPPICREICCDQTGGSSDDSPSSSRLFSMSISRARSSSNSLRSLSASSSGLASSAVMTPISGRVGQAGSAFRPPLRSRKNAKPRRSAVGAPRAARQQRPLLHRPGLFRGQSTPATRNK